MKSAREFTLFLDVSPSTITRAIDERNPKTPGLELLMKVAEKTETDLLILVEMAYPEAVNRNRLSPSSQLLAQSIERLSEGGKEAVRKLVKAYES